MAGKSGYGCEECGERIRLATTRSELEWLSRRRHVVKEVSRHLSGGLDGWIDDGLAFLDRHEGHTVSPLSDS